MKDFKMFDQVVGARGGGQGYLLAPFSGD